MTVNKRKKNSRLRGSHTHGWGAMKKHRGAGNRGGRGAAGSGKRADSKKPSIWKGTYFGKHGFTGKPKGKAVNASYLEEHIDLLVSKKSAKPQAGGYSIDLKAMGFSKLLGRGKLTKKLLIECDSASARAVEAVKAAGGQVKLRKGASDGSKEHTSESS